MPGKPGGRRMLQALQDNEEEPFEVNLVRELSCNLREEAQTRTKQEPSVQRLESLPLRVVFGRAARPVDNATIKREPEKPRFASCLPAPLLTFLLFSSLLIFSPLF